MRFRRATTALTLGTVLALVLPTAAGACDHDDWRGGWTSRARDYSTVYLYRKVDATKPASWENSGRQTLILITDGLSFVDTIDIGLLPSDVCGEGWGIQEDLVRGLTREEQPTVIDRTTGEGILEWPPILDSRHRELSDYVDVPDCVEVVPDIVTPPVVTPPVVTPPVETPPVVIEVSPVVVVPAAPTAPAATAVRAAPSFTG
jgi:hypothetical protein